MWIDLKEGILSEFAERSTFAVNQAALAEQAFYQRVLFSQEKAREKQAKYRATMSPERRAKKAEYQRNAYRARVARPVRTYNKKETIQ